MVYLYLSALCRYWGQNSYGAAGGAQSGWQQPIDFYCQASIALYSFSLISDLACDSCLQDDSIDVFPIAFLNVFFGAGGLPSLDLANVSLCRTEQAWARTHVLYLALDVQHYRFSGV